MSLPDGIVAVVRRECPTCVLVAPVLGELAERTTLTVYSQDDATFPDALPGVVDDTSLAVSYGLDLITVPTLVKVEAGEVVGRLEGWLRPDWEAFTGVSGLGAGLPEYRPGCGSRTLDPGMAEELEIRYGGRTLRSRRVELAELEDEHEALFDRGWSDGLPVVAPTEARVLRMLAGTTRAPEEVVAVVPPDLVECTVEKVAVNAVLAGCKPEYLPVVLAAVEAACSDAFNVHGLLATTYFSGPVIVVNGPIRRAIGMNSGGNVLGQGNRANLTIGRALQLVVRNVGGGRPGGVDRATMGNPGKLSFCFAEDEEGSPWEPLSVSRGAPQGRSALTLFAGEGSRGITDQQSRTPESLARSLAAGLRSVSHPKLPLGFDALLVVSPEHARTFRTAGWTRERLVDEFGALLLLPAEEVVRGAGGIAEGVAPEALAALGGGPVPKFRPGGLLVVHAGGRAGMFSAVIGGWVNGAAGSDPVTVEIDAPAQATTEVGP
ncbi:MAG: thioredoxin [Actinomycetota bacterium]|nr:thioredoxin [Actinomycetota bacterium]